MKHLLSTSSRLSKGLAVKSLFEAVGSMDNAMQSIKDDFYEQFPDNGMMMNSSNSSNSVPVISGFNYVTEIFDTYVIVHNSECDPDCYYKVNYTKLADGYTFDDMFNWQMVGLTYKSMPMMMESKKKRFNTTTLSTVEIIESTNTDKVQNGLHIKAVVLNADKPTSNNTVYSTSVLKESIQRLKAFNRLNESLGQGRLALISGEADHPKDKGNSRPLTLETIFAWNDVYLNESSQMIADGFIIPTADGRDLMEIAKAGVQIPFSIRGYGDSEVKNGLEYIKSLEFTGIDASQTASDQNTGIIQIHASKNIMNDRLKKLIEKFPAIFASYSKEQLESMNEDAVKIIESSIRGVLGISESADLLVEADKMIVTNTNNAKQINESAKKASIESAIVDFTRDLKFGVLNSKFIEAVKTQKFESAEAVKVFCDSLSPAYSALTSQEKLAQMGYNSAKVTSISVKDVYESETGLPAYTRAAREITESIIRQDHGGELKLYDIRKPTNRNQIYASNYLKEFDKNNARALIEESKKFEEAELTTDLSLPVSITRTIIDQLLPNLVATSIFDFGFAEANNENIFFETYGVETGFTAVIAMGEINNSPTPAIGGYFQLANRRITVGTFVLKNAAEAVTYVEGTDYVVDYEEGIVWILATIVNAQILHSGYTYSAIRKVAELGPIERLKNTLASMQLPINADRLAMALSNDVVIFSKTQLGYDAYSRLLKNLIFTQAKLIDKGIFMKAISCVLRIASNSGGTWNKGGAEATSGYITKLGVSKTLMINRYVMPQSYLMSVTNLDALSKDATFTAANSRVDNTLMDNGFAGRINGLPIYMSTEFPNNYGLTIMPELVIHRTLRSGTMHMEGPFPMYDTGTNPAKLLPGKEWYIEEYNGNISPLPQKGSYVVIT